MRSPERTVIGPRCGETPPPTVLSVERHANFPAWLGPWIEAKTGMAKDCLGGYRHALNPFAEYGCVDHYGRIGPYITFEPYDSAMNADKWRGLLAFCDEIGLDVKISAESSWNPTRTILIMIWPKGKPGFPSWDGKLSPEEKQQLKKEAKERSQRWITEGTSQAGK